MRKKTRQQLFENVNPLSTAFGIGNPLSTYIHAIIPGEPIRRYS